MPATTTGGASGRPRAPGARGAFPYFYTTPEGVCELCHRPSDVLAAVTIAPARKVEVERQGDKVMRWRMARVVWACGRHAGDNGAPLIAPNQTMAAGTSRLKPQAEQLFDQIPYRAAGEAERRWTS